MPFTVRNSIAPVDPEPRLLPRAVRHLHDASRHALEGFGEGTLPTHRAAAVRPEASAPANALLSSPPASARAAPAAASSTRRPPSAAAWSTGSLMTSDSSARPTPGRPRGLASGATVGLIARATLPNTRRAYAMARRQLDAWLDGRPLDSSVAAYLGHLREAGRAPATAAMVVAAVKHAARDAGTAAPIEPRLHRRRRLSSSPSGARSPTRPGGGRTFGGIESAQTQVLADALLMLGDRLLPAGVGVGGRRRPGGGLGAVHVARPPRRAGRAGAAPHAGGGSAAPRVRWSHRADGPAATGGSRGSRGARSQWRRRRRRAAAALGPRGRGGARRGAPPPVGHPGERQVGQRGRRVAGAERGRALVAKAGLLERALPAQVVVAEDEHPTPRTGPQLLDQVLVVERVRVGDVAQADNGVVGAHRCCAKPRACGLPSRGGSGTAGSSSRRRPGPGGGGRTRSTSWPPGVPRCHLPGGDRREIALRRGPHNRLGFAVATPPSRAAGESPARTGSAPARRPAPRRHRVHGSGPRRGRHRGSRRRAGTGSRRRRGAHPRPGDRGPLHRGAEGGD